MATININKILGRVYGFRGLPFPGKLETEQRGYVADGFTAPVQTAASRSRLGTPLWGTNSLGRPVFLPARLGGIDLPNPLISITGEKSIVETDVVNVGTVFEKVFTRPYDITIICTLLWNAYTDGNNGGAALVSNSFPEAELTQMEQLYVRDAVLTLECALTDIFLQPKDNFVVKRLSILDMQGVENAQVIQIEGKSNVDFLLELK